MARGEPRRGRAETAQLSRRNLFLLDIPIKVDTACVRQAVSAFYFLPRLS